MTNKNLKMLYSEQQIADRVSELGKQISEFYTGMGPLLCICVLKGASVFFADLIRKIDSDSLLVDFITLSSYGQGRTSTGDVEMLDNLSENPNGRHILIVEDIIDSGLTMNFMTAFLGGKNAASIRTVALLDKPSCRKVEVSPDFTAFTLAGDEFVVGYGLDLNQRYRHLSAIYQIN